MPRDYDWDLEPPVDDTYSVSRTFGPKYDDELRDLYRVMQIPPSVDSALEFGRRSEEIDKWERTIELATDQFEAVPGVAGSDEDRAEMMFDTGEMLIYNLLDEFGDAHVEYYQRFRTERDTASIDELRDSYQEAYDVIDSIDDDDHLAGGGLDNSKAGGDIGGSIGDTDDNLGGSI